MSEWTKERHAELISALNNYDTLDPDVKYGLECHFDVDDARDAIAEIERLQARVQELLEDQMLEICYLCSDTDDAHAGWYDTMGRRTACEAAEELVALGLWERHPDGSGRRRFYRPIARPECGSSGPCPCSEAHAGSDGACNGQ